MVLATISEHYFYPIALLGIPKWWYSNSNIPSVFISWKELSSNYLIILKSSSCSGGKINAWFFAFTYQFSEWVDVLVTWTWPWVCWSLLFCFYIIINSLSSSFFFFFHFLIYTFLAVMFLCLFDTTLLIPGFLVWQNVVRLSCTFFSPELKSAISSTSLGFRGKW